ncbi:MAG: hypothetical protein U1C49_00065 [Candidatus Andersenbacteria bacterium]|nr:hypothetical protein [bacterium]MDZ4225219.1 hypothetical protein [Candidatus Andersenbacteria bacterium]
MVKDYWQQVAQRKVLLLLAILIAVFLGALGLLYATPLHGYIQASLESLLD